MRGVLLILIAGLVACGPGPESWPAGRPRIDTLSFLQQSAEDPYRLELEVVFQDTDGDLGAGSLELLVDCEVVDVRPMAEVFARQIPELPVTVTRGELSLGVTLSENIKLGETFEVGVVLIDGGGERSNEPTLEIQAFAAGG